MIKYIYSHRRGTTAEWALQSSLVPYDGEIVIEDCNNGRKKIFIGDGVTPFSNLHPLSSDDFIWDELDGKANITDGTVVSDNADFAEIGEWYDGNPNDENRIGYFVTLKKTIEGFVIEKATSASDVCGVIVSSPAFSGNASEKYNASGNLLPQYDYVALLGLVSVIDNGTCTVPGKCMPTSDGSAIPSSNNMGFNVISRIDSTHIEVFVRPGADMLQRIRSDVLELEESKENISNKVTDWSETTSDTNYPSEKLVKSSLDLKLDTSLKGAASGLAELDANGKVPSSQLPSYVDDVLEYANLSSFPSSGETDKIYIAQDTNKTYRWSGSTYVVISETIALGETESTAYRGDRGAIAYSHSQTDHARTDATKVESSSTNGNIKINGEETTVYTHPSGTNPHGTTKADLGLGNVENKSSETIIGEITLSDIISSLGYTPIATPSDGEVGNILKKTENGVEWGNAPSGSGGGTTIFVQSSEPGSAIDGDLWIDTTN